MERETRDQIIAAAGGLLAGGVVAHLLTRAATPPTPNYLLVPPPSPPVGTAPSSTTPTTTPSTTPTVPSTPSAPSPEAPLPGPAPAPIPTTPSHWTISVTTEDRVSWQGHVDMSLLAGAVARTYLNLGGVTVGHWYTAPVVQQVDNFPLLPSRYRISIILQINAGIPNPDSVATIIAQRLAGELVGSDVVRGGDGTGREVTWQMAEASPSSI